MLVTMDGTEALYKTTFGKGNGTHVAGGAVSTLNSLGRVTKFLNEKSPASCWKGMITTWKVQFISLDRVFDDYDLDYLGPWTAAWVKDYIRGMK